MFLRINLLLEGYSSSVFIPFWAKNTSMLNFQPHVIVHCAAERRPDVVENHPDTASQLNVDASGNLAKEAAAIGAFLIYISSDYVFDGTNPPYREEDIPNPLNLYGKTKLEGEKAVLENNLGKTHLFSQFPDSF